MIINLFQFQQILLKEKQTKSIKIINDKGDVAFGVSNGINIYSSTNDNFERFLSDTGVGGELNVLSVVSDNKFLLI